MHTGVTIDLKRIRKEQGISLKTLAAISGLSVRYYVAVEKAPLRESVQRFISWAEELWLRPELIKTTERTTRSTLIATLKARRKAQGLRQFDIADRIGINRAHFNRMECGHSLTVLDNFICWANCLGYDLILTGYVSGSVISDPTATPFKLKKVERLHICEVEA